MPRTAIISDIHSNLHALYAVIADVQAEQCTDIVCLGDVVGYGAYPRECLDYIRSLNCLVVKGNHDAAVVARVGEDVNPCLVEPEDDNRPRETEFQKKPESKMNPVAGLAMEWTRRQLDEDQLTWLARLQYVRIVRSTFTMVHSCLEQPKSWNYIFNASDATSSFLRQFSPLCFHGHTHVPKVFSYDGMHAREEYDAVHPLYLEGYSEFEPLPEKKYFVNVGSVGQPRDNDPRACYAIYDSNANRIILKRVEYDIAQAQDAILSVGLPPFLAERLGKGC